VVGVALDEADAAREWIEAAHPTYPVVLDPDHVVAERYGFVNVPTAVWIDEDDRIVRPPDITPADDMWRDFTGIDSAVHHDALRAWVREGITPLADAEVRRHQPTPTDAQQRARAERRLGAWLHRRGHVAEAAHHFEEAQRLAPMDWTIRRGTMPLRGDDPFGDAFFAFLAEWQDAGAPGYGWGNSALRATPPGG
jgi:hypothetical protein